MDDAVAEYMRSEAELLAHRLGCELAGTPYSPVDSEELRIEGELERLWESMSIEDRRRLRKIRELRSAPWFGAFAASTGETALVDAPSPRGVGVPPRRFAERTGTCT